MKIFKNLFALAAALVVSAAAFANNSEIKADGDFFLGKWEIALIGTPSGDVASILNVSKVEGALKATLSMEGMEPLDCGVETEGENTLVVSFIAEGYDVFITLNKVDDNSVKGDAMNMFDVTGKRVVE